MVSLYRRCGVAVGLILLALGMISVGQARAESRSVNVTVTTAERATAKHLTARYLHLNPTEGHPQIQADRALPKTMGTRLLALPPAPTATFDPSGVDYDPYVGGAYVSSARVHNVFVNCPGSGPSGNKIARCWGTMGTDPHSTTTPDQFVSDFNLSTYSHVTDQYVGTTAKGRYPSSTDVNVTYPISSAQASFQDVLNIVTQAATALGPQFTGYNDLYLIYFPVGIDVCTATACVSQGTFCSYHATADGTIKSMPVHVLFAVEPYQDIKGCRIILGPNEVNDSTASNIGHELAEMITDPDGDAWKNLSDQMLNGSEVADVCDLHKFIRYPTVTLPNTAQGNQYKIQLLYSDADSACVVQP